MKITVLGCHAPYAPAESACSGYLVESENFNLMIDCGHGAFSQLQKHINFRTLNALVITHFHPDHSADIHAVRHAFLGALRNQSRKDPLVVYAPSEPEHSFKELCEWRDVFVTIPLEDAVLRTNRLGGITLKFFLTSHPVPTYGVRVEEDTKVFTYTSDTSWNNDLVKCCLGSDLLLAEASLREIDIVNTKRGHMTAKQAGLLAHQAAAKQLVITHFWPEYNINQLKREAEVTYEAKVELAITGKNFIV